MTPEATTRTPEAVPHFMRRRVQLVTKINALVNELDESLDRIEAATEPSAQGSERER